MAKITDINEYNRLMAARKAGNISASDQAKLTNHFKAIAAGWPKHIPAPTGLSTGKLPTPKTATVVTPNQPSTGSGNPTSSLLPSSDSPTSPPSPSSNTPPAPTVSYGTGQANNSGKPTVLVPPPPVNSGKPTVLVPPAPTNTGKPPVPAIRYGTGQANNSGKPTVLVPPPPVNSGKPTVLVPPPPVNSGKPTVLVPPAPTNTGKPPVPASPPPPGVPPPPPPPGNSPPPPASPPPPSGNSSNPFNAPHEQNLSGQALADRSARRIDRMRQKVDTFNQSYDHPQATVREGERMEREDDERERKGHRRKGGGQYRKIAGHTMAALQETDSVKAYAEANEAAGAAVGKVPIAGKPIEALSKFTASVLGSVDRLKKWNDLLHEGNMRFAEFSGAMAAVQARQEVRDIMYQKQQGDRTAGTAEDLEEGRNRMRDSTAGFDAAWANIKNELGGILSNAFSSAMENVGLKNLGDWLAEITGGMNKDMPLRDSLKDNSKTGVDWDEMGRPKRFR